MKTINLYIDFEFTSMSPDAQPISLAVVSDVRDIRDYPILTRPINPGEKFKGIDQSKSFYDEFSDFDLNRCDDWVKENVVKKLKYNNCEPSHRDLFWDNYDSKGDFKTISSYLKHWLSQFSDYQIQFVVDCGYMDWWWMLQLLAEWDDVRTSEEHIDYTQSNRVVAVYRKAGLPKLPANISPVPLDLNDLIAHKKGVSVKEAFEMSREELAFGKVAADSTDDKHNALWDAKVIKEVYNKLNKQPQQ